jgi:hypothetical protein|tara:strand:+ start:49094 stop:50320 length:1227 start_codon:yes stop_codon:yes gene_type:complete
MTTTYVRLKNRRGNKADLPKPLAEGELGFALDTRELYIGGGSQSDKNRMVQVNNYVNAQLSVQSDLDNRLSVFKLAGTESFLGDGTNANTLTLKGGTLSIPTGATIAATSDFYVIKYDLDNFPTFLDPSTYSMGNIGASTFDFTFTSTNIPEANSVIVVTKWTEVGTRSAIAGALPSLESDKALANNQILVDYSTGTGFIDTASDYTQTQAKTALEALNQISSADANANLNILGNITDLPYSARKLTIDGDLKIELDSPDQASTMTAFLNNSQGSTTATVANNIKVYTQDSKPTFESNQYVSNTHLLKSTIAHSTSDQVMSSFTVADNNTLFVDYSIKYSTAFAVGQLRVISDGTNAHFVDDRTETDPTSDVTFSVAINSGNLELRVSNGGSSHSATVSYILKRWLTQ